MSEAASDIVRRNSCSGEEGCEIDPSGKGGFAVAGGILFQLSEHLGEGLASGVRVLYIGGYRNRTEIMHVEGKRDGSIEQDH